MLSQQKLIAPTAVPDCVAVCLCSSGEIRGKVAMSDDKESPVHNLEENTFGSPPMGQVGGPSAGESVPMQMKLLSTWEVRKMPANCVCRLCTLTVTRLEVVHPFESGHGSIVMAASMKTPHRHLRSNEIKLGSDGLLNIPLQVTFCLQYPHFLKRGGNVLEIRLQRRKRVRNRPLGGYKTLARGKIEMSQVLQHSFQGKVRLYVEKLTEHVAVVTVGSLTSTVVDVDRRGEGSSDEDEDDIFSDDLVERGSDSDSGDNEQPSFVVPSGHGKGKRFRPSTAAVLRLLRLSRSPSKGNHPVDDELLGDEGEEFRGSSVAFASSPSDSDEEEEEESAIPTRPTLSPFFGSDRCSMVSLPTSAKSAEAMVHGRRSPLPPSQARDSGGGGGSSGHSNLSKKYGSLERAIHTERMDSPILTSIADGDWEVDRGRVWFVEDGLPASQTIIQGLEREGESASLLSPTDKDTIQTLLSLMNTVLRHWREKKAFCVILVGGDNLVSRAAQALVKTSCSPDHLHFAVIPTDPGLMSARLSSLDDDYLSTFPVESQWIEALQDSVDPLLNYIQAATHHLPLPLAQATLQRPTGEASGSSLNEQCLPFMCNVSIGAWEEPDMGGIQSTLPTSPTGGGGVSGGSGQQESPELVLEYWSPKGQSQKPHQSSVKVRSIIVSCAHQVLNVTATKEKKGKGIRIRKPKETDTGGSIVSLTATQLVCRPTNKSESMTVMVDGVEREGVATLKLVAAWEQTQNKTFSFVLTSALESGL